MVMFYLIFGFGIKRCLLEYMNLYEDILYNSMNYIIYGINESIAAQNTLGERIKYNKYIKNDS